MKYTFVSEFYSVYLLDIFFLYTKNTVYFFISIHKEPDEEKPSCPVLK